MALLGRNNFGPQMIYVRPQKFLTRRQYKKALRKIVGRRYPLNLNALTDKGMSNSGYLMVNERALRILNKMEDAGHKADNVRFDSYYQRQRAERKQSLSRQCWGMMAENFGSYWKMKEPK